MIGKLSIGDQIGETHIRLRNITDYSIILIVWMKAIFRKIHFSMVTYI